MAEFSIARVRQTMEGDGASVARLMPVPRLRHYDPFVLFDHFNLQPGSGFAEHPHRGFEAVSYILHGALKHVDNLGNTAVIERGAAQRFTAGKGIVHSEMPEGKRRCCGIQLWVNLPHRVKSTDAEYQQLAAPMLPGHWEGEALVRTILGEGSPLQLFTPVLFQDVSLPALERLRRTLVPGFRGFVYVISGGVAVAGQRVGKAQAIFLEGAVSIEVGAEQDSRFVLAFGQPHGEPIVQRGTFVD